MQDFDEWYAAYPRHVARAAAMKAWAKLTLPERQQAKHSLPDHVRYWRGKGTEWEFLPHPASWLNAKRFLDELPSARPATVNGSVPPAPSLAVPPVPTPQAQPALGAVTEPPNIRLATGPRPLGEVFAGLKAVLNKRAG